MKRLSDHRFRGTGRKLACNGLLRVLVSSLLPRLLSDLGSFSSIEIVQHTQRCQDILHAEHPSSLRCGLARRGIKAFERAIALVGKDVAPEGDKKTMKRLSKWLKPRLDSQSQREIKQELHNMQDGLDEAKAINEAELKMIDTEPDPKKHGMLRKAYSEQDHDIFMKGVEVYSKCYEQQVEGLLRFAEQMQWPWINELRNYAEDVYSNLRGGEVLPADLHDWLYGMTLAGQWLSFKIMTALILCTPSIKKRLGIAAYFGCWLSLPKNSHWRVRKVLGRVLGCLSNAVSLCGWIGPCPPVELCLPATGRFHDIAASKQEYSVSSSISNTIWLHR